MDELVEMRGVDGAARLTASDSLTYRERPLTIRLLLSSAMHKTRGNLGGEAQNKLPRSQSADFPPEQSLFSLKREGLIP